MPRPQQTHTYQHTLANHTLRMDLRPNSEMAHFQEIPYAWSMAESPADDSNMHYPTLGQQWLRMSNEFPWHFEGIEPSGSIVQSGVRNDVFLSLDGYSLETPATRIFVHDDGWSGIFNTSYHTDATPVAQCGLLGNTTSFWGPSFAPPSTAVSFEALSGSPSVGEIFGLFPNSPTTSMASSQMSPCPATEWSGLPPESTLVERITISPQVPNQGDMVRPKAQMHCRTPKHKQDGYPRVPKRISRKFERPETCPHCGTGFSYQADLTRHIDVHHSADLGVPRPVYTCGIAACVNKYNRSDHLYRHRIGKHGWPPGGQRQARRAVSRFKGAR